VNYLYVSILTPLPGTKLRERFENEGRIRDIGWENYDLAHVAVEPENMTTQEAEEIIWEMYRKFYSLGNIVRRAWRFRRQYLRFFPRDNVVEEVYFQLHQRRAAKQHHFPFTLGLNVNGT